MNQFDYIAKTYGKRFHRGQRVMAYGKPGNVTSADQYVHVRIETCNGEGYIGNIIDTVPCPECSP